MDKDKDENKFTINVKINGTRLPLTIHREDEILYRDAEKIVNHYIEKYSKDYSGKSMEEILIYTAYQMAVLVAKQQYHQDVEPLAEKVEKLNNLLRNRKKEVQD